MKKMRNQFFDFGIFIFFMEDFFRVFKFEFMFVDFNIVGNFLYICFYGYMYNVLFYYMYIIYRLYFFDVFCVVNLQI